MLCRHAVVQCAKKSSTVAATVLPFEAMPAPRAFPLVGTTPALIAAGGTLKLHEYVDMRHKTLGPVYREKLGPVTCVFLSDPEEMRAVFAQEGKHPRHLLPEAWVLYNRLYGCQRGLFFMDGPTWCQHRKVANNLLLKGDLAWIDRACDVVSERTVQDLESIARNGAEIQDLEGFLYKWSLDVIVAVLLGSENYEKLRPHLKADVTNLASIVHLVFQTSAKLALIPAGFAAKFRIPAWRRFVDAVDAALSGANSLVQRLLEPQHRNYHQGLLSKLLDEDVEEPDIRRIIADLVLAAGDTTAYAMAWTLYLLGKHRTVQEQLRAGDKDFSKNVIRETLRLYPVAPFLTRILPEDSIICGYCVPKDALIVMSICTSGKDERYFHDAPLFNPRRWDKADRYYNGGMQMASMPFAMGARSCVGKKIAEVQLRMTMEKIVDRFDVEVCNEKDVEMVLKLVAVSSEPIRLKLKKRG